MVFADRQYAGELWRDELAAFCEANPTMTGTSGPVDVSEACPVLRAWDVHDNLDSNGALLFRRFASRALGAVPVAVAALELAAADPGGAGDVVDESVTGSGGIDTVRGIFPTVIFCSEPGIDSAPSTEIREVYESILARRANGRNGAAS